MSGTLLCAVTRDEDADAVVALGVGLCERLGLRVVLAHAVDGIDGEIGGGDGSESVSVKASRVAAEQRLLRLATRFGVLERAERRIGVGEPAVLLARIAAEEAADLIVVGSSVRGWRRRLDSPLAASLVEETAVPVVIAPPRAASVVGETRDSLVGALPSL